MEIVHFCPRPSFSGLEQYAWLLAKEQKYAGHNVKFVVLEGSPLEKKCIQAGIPVLHLNIFSKLGVKLFSHADDPKVLHLHSTLDVRHLGLWLILRNFLGAQKIKVILQTHIWLDHKKKDPFHQLLYSGVDEVWCSSSMAKANLEQILPVQPEQVRFVNYGRDIKTIDKFMLTREMARHTLKLPEDKIIVGSVNRIDPEKGTLELVRGMIPLLQDREDLALAWAGGPTGMDADAAKYNRKITHFVQELPVEIRRRIYFIGNLPDSFKYLNAFDGYILPTYKECFSLALMEAQVAGLPCMGTDAGGTPEIVREGQTGWLFKPRSSEAITEVVQRFLDDRDKWETFSKNARLRIERDFDFPVVFQKILAMYED